MHPLADRSSCQGFTLLELMVTLTILAVTMTVLLKSTAGLQDQARYNQTVQRVEMIRDAIINVGTVNGVPTVSGFVADMGRLPRNIHELLERGYCPANITADEPACGGWERLAPWQNQRICQDGTLITDSQPACATPQIQVSLSAGWNGPYLQTSQNPSHVDDAGGSDAFTDGWGNPGLNPLNVTPDPRHNYGWGFDSGSTSPARVYLFSYGNGCHLDVAMCRGNNGSPDLLDLPYPLPDLPPYNQKYDANTGRATPPPDLPPDPNDLTHLPTPIVRPRQWQVIIGDTSASVPVGVNVTLYGSPPSCSIAAPPDLPPFSQTQCLASGGTWGTKQQPLCLNLYFIQDGRPALVSSDRSSVSPDINATIAEDGLPHTVHFAFSPPTSGIPVSLPAGNAAFTVHAGPCTPKTAGQTGTTTATYPLTGRQAVPVTILPQQTPSFYW